MPVSLNKGCRALTPEQTKQVIEFFRGKYKERNAACFVLGVVTGFRISELLSLKVYDVYDGKEIREYVTVQKKNMKGGKANKTGARTTLINDQAKPYLLAIIGDRDLKEPLFVSQKKGEEGKIRPLSRTSMYAVYRKVYDDMGLPTHGYGTHTTRKTFAVFCYHQFDKDIRKLQGAMGHSDVSTTAKYVPDDTDQLINVLKKPRF